MYRMSPTIADQQRAHRSFTDSGGWISRASLVASGLLIGLGMGGCPPVDGPSTGGTTQFNNTTDFTNNNAQHVGSAACRSCHPGIGATAERHGHAQALKVIQGAAPEYPAAGEFAGVPNPPAGFTYDQVSYVISGYLLNAFFVDEDGFIVTTGVDGVDAEWWLRNPINNTQPSFVEYLPAQAEPKPFAYECFRCHTVGPEPFSEENPRRQDNRPGIGGTWVEAGVGCEACHGPGSNHVPNPGARDLYVDPVSDTCARCHIAGDDPGVIVASAGFVSPNTQLAELRASGGHGDFDCTICHNPHAGVKYDRANAIRNDCQACHGDVNLALHEGKVFTFGDHVEPVTCESCHMPPLGRSANGITLANADGPPGRVGDVHSHIYRISTAEETFDAMYSADGSQVLLDEQGRAQMTLDYVCLRCHNSETGTFPIDFATVAQIAENMHTETRVSAAAALRAAEVDRE